MMYLFCDVLMAWRWEKESANLTGRFQATDSGVLLSQRSQCEMRRRRWHLYVLINDLAIIQINLLLKGWRPQILQPFPKHTKQRCCLQKCLPPLRTSKSRGGEMEVT